MNATIDREVALLSRVPSTESQPVVRCLELASALERQGEWRGAAACLREALEQEPARADIAFRLGNLMTRLGVLEEAAASYGHALQCRPEFAEAWFNLGVVRSLRQEFCEALHCYQRALRLRPRYAEAHNNLGVLLHAAGRRQEALAAYAAALKANPRYAQARFNRAQLYEQLEELEAAERDYRHALRDEPNSADAHNNLGNLLLGQNRVEEARRCYRRALQHDAQHGQARWNLAWADLLTGRFREGWAGYEHRFSARHRPRHDGPRWRGEPLEGRRLLIWAEQGLGDTLQMVRWVERAAAAGGPVVLECHPPLTPLFQNLPGVEQVVAIGNPLPPCDLQIPLLSLPGLLGVDLQSLPGPVPYLQADPERVGRWREWLAAYRRPHWGLAWAGNPQFERDRYRSLPAELCRPLLERPGTWFSVRPDAAPLPGVVPLSSRLKDFADTAALLQCLDLLISVDTAPAHLAGAMGREVWILLPFAPDWRWMLERLDSPWYPSMRLFRQRSRGDWKGVIAEVVQALDRRLTSPRMVL